MAVWTHIAHESLSLPATSVTWSSIPTDGTYDHLIIFCSVRSDRSIYKGHGYLTFNDSSGGTDYSETSLKTTDLTVAESGRSSARANSLVPLTSGADTVANAFAASKIYIPHYASSAFKPFFVESSVPNNVTTANRYENKVIAGLWSNPAAIDEIKIEDGGSGDWVAHSTFDLYGILGV